MAAVEYGRARDGRPGQDPGALDEGLAQLNAGSLEASHRGYRGGSVEAGRNPRE